MDTDARSAFALRVWGYKQGEVVSLMVHLGDRLGLYKAMVGIGPVSAGELAERTGLHPRWLLEWLRSQGAAGLLETADGEHFELTKEGAEVLADETGSVWFAAGAFHGAVVTTEVLPRLVEAFRTGRGLAYDELGPGGAHGIERFTAPWTRLVLVPGVLPSLDGVVGRLEQGARVADVGCGAGLALEVMATAYPASRFDGYDPSAHALDRARARLEAAGLTNVELHRAGADGLPGEPTFDLVVALDCLHDMARPAEALRAMRAAMLPGATLLVKEIRAAPGWAENLKNPMLALMYGTSVATCLSSALSEPGGAGLGTLGLHPDLAEEMLRGAGFSEVTVHDFDDPRTSTTRSGPDRPQRGGAVPEVGSPEPGHRPGRPVSRLITARPVRDARLGRPHVGDVRRVVERRRDRSTVRSGHELELA